MAGLWDGSCGDCRSESRCLYQVGQVHLTVVVVAERGLAQRQPPSLVALATLRWMLPMTPGGSGALCKSLQTGKPLIVWRMVRFGSS